MRCKVWTFHILYKYSGKSLSYGGCYAETLRFRSWLWFMGFPTLLQGCRSWPVELECYLPRQALKRAFVFYLMYTGSWNRFFNLLLFFNTSVQSPCLNFGLKASRQRIKHPTHFPICFLEVKKQKKVLYWISQDCRLIWEWGNKSLPSNIT